jgi:hypothetical protein
MRQSGLVTTSADAEWQHGARLGFLQVGGALYARQDVAGVNPAPQRPAAQGAKKLRCALRP